MLITIGKFTIPCCLKEGSIASRTAALVEIGSLAVKETTLTSIVDPKLVISVSLQTVGWVAAIRCLPYAS